MPLSALHGLVTSEGTARRYTRAAVGPRAAPYALVAPCACSGQGTRSTCSRSRLYKRAVIDVVIVRKGGGSAEDWWAFNDEQVRAPSPHACTGGHGAQRDRHDPRRLVAIGRDCRPRRAELVSGIRNELVRGCTGRGAGDSAPRAARADDRARSQRAQGRRPPRPRLNRALVSCSLERPPRGGSHRRRCTRTARPRRARAQAEQAFSPPRALLAQRMRCSNACTGAGKDLHLADSAMHGLARCARSRPGSAQSALRAARQCFASRPSLDASRQQRALRGYAIASAGRAVAPCCASADISKATDFAFRLHEWGMLADVVERIRDQYRYLRHRAGRGASRSPAMQTPLSRQGLTQLRLILRSSETSARSRPRAQAIGVREPTSPCRQGGGERWLDVTPEARASAL